MNRLEAVARYILDKTGAMEYRKLSTIIYLADREHYLREGRSISGARHFKRDWGVEVEGLRKVVNAKSKHDRLV